MAETLRVLIVEDSAGDAELLVRTLRRDGYDPTAERVETAGALEAALATQRGISCWPTTACRDSTRWRR